MGPSGDGWVECDLGHRHWGRYGAAGLLLYRRLAGTAEIEVLLQHRAEWSHHGGTWGVLGGAGARSETSRDTALREAHEEARISGSFTVDGVHDDEHGGWGYRTVIAQASDDLTAAPASTETLDVQWWPAKKVSQLPLHPGFRPTWPLLHDALRPWHIVVDVANVMGSQPDGWWHDRAGAALRLLGRVGVLAETGFARESLDGVRIADLLHRRWPRLTLIVEGAARPVAAHAAAQVRVVAAAASGDDAIVAEVRALQGEIVLVVTSDRDLRRRVEELGATTTGPRWLIDRLPPPP